MILCFLERKYRAGQDSDYRFVSDGRYVRWIVLRAYYECKDVLADMGRVLCLHTELPFIRTVLEYKSVQSLLCPYERAARV